MSEKIVRLEIVDSCSDVAVKDALEGMLDQDEVIIIGVKNNRMIVATSSGKPEHILLRIEQAKLHMLDSFCGVSYGNQEIE